jgi:endonuclease/exonuclease/phosphatase family metal-dependent hydrolase
MQGKPYQQCKSLTRSHEWHISPGLERRTSDNIQQMSLTTDVGFQAWPQHQSQQHFSWNSQCASAAPTAIPSVPPSAAVRPVEQPACAVNEQTQNRKSLTVMTWNLMRDFPHFLSPNPAFAWHNREPRIIKIIQDVDPDILTLQECIDLPQEPILRFLNKLKPLGYDFEIFTDVQGKNHKQLKVVTCWKQNSIYRHSSRTLWLSPTPTDSQPASAWRQKVARPIGVSCFMHSFSDRPLWVWNTHLGHSEIEKKLSCELLVQLMSEICIGRHASVLMGDFNIFARSDCYNLRSILTGNNKYRMQDLGVNARTIIGDYAMPNTFVSSSIDREQLPRGCVGDRLDHCFGRFVSLDGPMRVWNKTMLAEEPPFLHYQDVFPSDHLPITGNLFC